MGIRFWRRAGAVVVLTLLLGLATVSVASAVSMGAQAISSPIIGTYGLERPLVTGASDQFWPAISGNYIAFEHGSPMGANDVRLYDISKNSAVTISDASTNADWRPRISGNRVVWMGRFGAQWEIMWYDIKAAKVGRLTTDPGYQAWPDISGNRVVWQDNRNGSDDIYMYDFSTGKYTWICSNAFEQRAPSISGNRVIWQDNRNGNWDIYWYDIAAKKEYQLTNSNDDEMTPAVGGSKAAYVRNKSGNYDVYLVHYFDANGSLAWYPGYVSTEDNPRIYGDTFVWHSNNGGNNSIYYSYSGNESQLFQLTESTGNESVPQMSGNRVVYFDDRNGTQDIYVTEIMRPKLSFSAPSAVGFRATTAVSGYLKRWDGSPLAGRTVQVQYMPYANRFTYAPWTVVSATTNSSGKYTATIPAMAARFGVRPVYLGDADAWSATAGEKTVLPKVALSKPSGPKSIKRSSYFTATGLLDPAETHGGKVYIKAYRYSSGKYRLKKTLITTLSPYDADTTKFARKFKFGTAGKWRIRAYYPGTFYNAASYSSWRYVRAK